MVEYQKHDKETSDFTLSFPYSMIKISIAQSLYAISRDKTKSVEADVSYCCFYFSTPNLYIVFCVYCSPGLSTTDGK